MNKYLIIIFMLCIFTESYSQGVYLYRKSSVVKDIGSRQTNFIIIKPDTTKKDTTTTKPTYRFQVFQNYPNPFNSTTTMQFHIPDISHVNITIYNTLGKEVCVLFNRNTQPGIYNVPWETSNIPTGVYFLYLRYRPQVGADITQVLKLILLK